MTERCPEWFFVGKQTLFGAVGEKIGCKLKQGHKQKVHEPLLLAGMTIRGKKGSVWRIKL